MCRQAEERNMLNDKIKESHRAMIGLDHKNLAEFWMNTAGKDLPEDYKLAFIYGNIEPDINVFTYLHAFRTGQKFHGHNNEYIMPTLQKMFKKYMVKPLTLHRCFCI